LLLVLSGLFPRTISSVLVWEACGCDLLAEPLAWFLLHLCIGDTWNSINNVERRKGTSAVVVLFVLGSVYNAVFRYLEVSEAHT
jgi:tryptophan-rich sensory protein